MYELCKRQERQEEECQKGKNVKNRMGLKSKDDGKDR